jgi:hypothetical protein
MIFGASRLGGPLAPAARPSRAAVPGAAGTAVGGTGLLLDQWLCLTYIGADGAAPGLAAGLDRAPAHVSVRRPNGSHQYMFQIVVLDCARLRVRWKLRLRPRAYVPCGRAPLCRRGGIQSAHGYHAFRFGPWNGSGER